MACPARDHHVVDAPRAQRSPHGVELARGAGREGAGHCRAEGREHTVDQRDVDGGEGSPCGCRHLRVRAGEPKAHAVDRLPDHGRGHSLGREGEGDRQHHCAVGTCPYRCGEPLRHGDRARREGHLVRPPRRRGDHEPPQCQESASRVQGGKAPGAGLARGAPRQRAGEERSDAVDADADHERYAQVHHGAETLGDHVVEQRQPTEEPPGYPQCAHPAGSDGEEHAERAPCREQPRAGQDPRAAPPPGHEERRRCCAEDHRTEVGRRRALVPEVAAEAYEGRPTCPVGARTPQRVEGVPGDGSARPQRSVQVPGTGEELPHWPCERQRHERACRRARSRELGEGCEPSGARTDERGDGPRRYPDDHHDGEDLARHEELERAERAERKPPARAAIRRAEEHLAPGHDEQRRADEQAQAEVPEREVRHDERAIAEEQTADERRPGPGYETPAGEPARPRAEGGGEGEGDVGRRDRTK